MSEPTLLTLGTAPASASSTQSRLELKSYSATIPMGSLAVGIDNIHHDVFLSPRFVQLARTYLLHLIRQSTKATFFGGMEMRPAKEQDASAFPKVLTELLQHSLTQAKFQKNIELDLLCRVSVTKFLTQEIAAQFSNVILEGKEWIRQRGEHFERSEQAHRMKARLAEMQAGRKGVIRAVGQQVHGILLEAEELLGKSRRALFGDDFAEIYGLLKNPLIFLDGGKDEIFFLEQYVLLGNYVRDPDRFESVDAFFHDFLRDSGLAAGPDSGYAETREAHERLVQQAFALRSEITALEEQRDAYQRKLSRGDGLLTRLLKNSSRPSDIRAALTEVEMRLKHQHVKLEEMGPQIETARQKLDFVGKQNQGRVGDYLNDPENARRLFDPTGEGESAATRSRLLDDFIRRLEERQLLLHLLTGYEIRSLYRDYCPPVHLQQLRRALVSREELKRVEDILKQFPAKRLSVRPLEELSRKIRRYTHEELRALVLRFAGDFMRLRRDLRNADHLSACMERVNLVASEQNRNLSRMNNALYEFLLPEEARPQQDRVLSHAIIKADVRGSTKITLDLIERGLNPASHFSLHLHEPVKKLLERYDARKVFIEGDAIILAIFESESNQSFQRAVAKACVLARQILAVSGDYNARAESGDLPRLELGLGVAFQGSAPTYWMDGDSRIMISRALNLSDRLSGCSKLARRLLARQKSHFSVFQFLTVMEGASEEEVDEFLVRFNLNGIELNEEGFQKLSEEISLDSIDMKLELPWGKETVTLFYGEVPIGESLELIVIRKGFARHLLPDGTIGGPTSHPYFEVCTAPALFTLVEALMRTAPQRT